jgi:hypothetical protein
MDSVKGDPVNSLPGHYPNRNRKVRAAFDTLEQEFEAEVPDVMRKAVEAREADPEAAAHILDEFSERCVNRVVTSLHGLLKEVG